MMSAIIRRASTAAAGFLFLIFMNMSEISAQPLLRMNVQGVIMDITGNPIDGTFSMKFSIHNSQSGGNEVWTETHTDVLVTDGLFNVYLGATNPLAVNPSIFGQYANLYLGITVENEPEFERVMLSAVPYSFYSNEADKAKTCTTLLGPATDLNCTGCAGAIDIASNSINSSHVVNGTIKDDDISTTAQISFTKLSGVAALNHSHTEYAPFTHDHNSLYYQKGEMDTLLAGKAAVVHNHDESYYSKSAVDGFLTGKSDTGHIHDDIYFTETEVGALLSGKSDTGHDHNSFYYTETEINAMLLGKSDVGHDHNSLYYTENEIDTFLLGKSDAGHDHDNDYFLKSDLSDPGTINTQSNPVDWSKLKNVPAGIADSKPFGDWTSVNMDEVYQAASDGFVVG
ncbi:MAG: hypothetical protein FJ088_10265, partial [Deltaproteobacteria bacterium]|nr:hypothetical protein [Deltaproteobacteria bacterium]